MTPNFFLLGPPRAGTTAVAAALDRHPQVFMSDPKEPNHFLYAGGNPYNLPLDQNVPDLEDYLRLFDRAGEAWVRGEASTCYLRGDHCAGEIARLAPRAKLLVILRNPVDRAFSMYRYWHRGERDFRSDPAVFREEFLQRTLISNPSDGCVPALEWLQDMGRYAKMLERYDEYFPREQIMLLRHDDLIADPAGFMGQVLDFLGVDPAPRLPVHDLNSTAEPLWRGLSHWLNFDIDNPARQSLFKLLGRSRLAMSLREAINQLNQRPAPTVPPAVYNELIAVYADELDQLAKRTQLDFSGWLSPR